jgi:hypothetical protein
MRYYLNITGIVVLFAAVSIVGLPNETAAQETPNIVVADMSYLYTGAVYKDSAMPASNPIQQAASRIVYALNDSIARRMAGTLLQAMNNRWGSSIKDVNLKVDKAENMLGMVPKFKPKIKKPDAGTQYIFLRIVDYGHSADNFAAMAIGGFNNSSLATTLVFECTVINGSGGNELFSRAMSLNLQRLPVPTGQYELRKVPCLPGDFMLAFDSAVNRFFSQAAPVALTIDVQPPCLFINDSMSRQVRQMVRFSNQENIISTIEGPELKWQLGRADNKKLGRVSKLGQNVAGGLLTLFTGLGTDRVSLERYLATIEMRESKQAESYVFLITYLEEEREDRERVRNSSGSYTTTTGFVSRTRYADPEQDSHLMLGGDTIASFRIIYTPAGKNTDLYAACWNGQDSATIVPMPAYWSNSGMYRPLQTEGTLYGKPISLQNRKDGNQLDMYYDSLHVATLRISADRPQAGIIYQADLEPRVLKALALFSSLPYSYFR